MHVTPKRAAGSVKQDASRISRPHPDVNLRDKVNIACGFKNRESQDADGAAIWRYDFGTTTWSTVAWVNDFDGESSGIVDASAWFGPGTWILDVQGHGMWVNRVRGDNVGAPGVTLKRESGQVMLMRIPGS